VNATERVSDPIDRHRGARALADLDQRHGRPLQMPPLYEAMAGAVLDAVLAGYTRRVTEQIAEAIEALAPSPELVEAAVIVRAAGSLS
jgi:hypothetical protein